MSKGDAVPNFEGQLVWCPADPSLGIGVVTKLEHAKVKIRFLRLQEERAYTTRSQETMVLRYAIRPGEKVRDRNGDEHRIADADPSGPLVIYELEDGTQLPENELIPEVRDVGPKARLGSLSLVHPEVVRARLRGLQLGALWPRSGSAAIFGSRALWLPHQIDVATRAIESDRVRLLLADEVGLGKTVEAALIYAGLRHEGRASRVLMLTPKALTIQWLGEIFRKTHELLVLLDDDRIEDARIDFPDLSPFEAHRRIVASIDMVAHDPVLAEEAAACDWDLVIVDEAHHLRWKPGEDGGNPAYRLVEQLSARTQHLLLLTATPMALDPAEYHALLRLLDPSRFDDPQGFATIRERVTAIREAAKEIDHAVDEDEPIGAETTAVVMDLLADDPEDTAEAKRFMALPSDHVDRPGDAEEVLDALRARHGLADYVVRNRRGPVGGLPDRQAQIFPLEPTEAQAHLMEIGESVMFELASTIDDPSERYQTLGRLLRALWATPRALLDVLQPISPELVQELAPYVAKVVSAPLDADGLPSADMRLRWLVRMLRRDEEDKLLVFVETDIAVRALAEALESCLGGKIATFHRGLSPRDQDRQVAWFRDPDGPQVMLSTEAGGEGRNFQFCNRVVLYDMPWRPATVEQRIGRIDRVGQDRDVHVLVPFFKSGYEAAILKVMQEAIGVLDETVGGIDHALEYVSDRLGDIIMNGGTAEDWKGLYRDTRALVTQTRERIRAATDPVLDHASFSPDRVEALMQRVPDDLEARTETFVRGYASHSKLEIHSKAPPVVGIEGAPGATRAAEFDTAYAATFSRFHALDHEEVEFLSFGHPLVEQALEWSQHADASSAALAICRGFNRDGAIFVWSFRLSLPDDVPEAGVYFKSQLYSFAVDEAGERVPEFDDILLSERALDRMDAKPLKAAGARWRRLVDQNYETVEGLALAAVDEEIQVAKERLEDSVARRERNVRRQYSRRILDLGPDGEGRPELEAERDALLDALTAERERLEKTIEHAQPNLAAAVAVRLVKAKHVSG